MSNTQGYIPKVTQTIGNTKGVLSMDDIQHLNKQNLWLSAGQLELIETKTFAGYQNLDFQAIKQETYGIHFMTISGYKVSAGSQDFGIQFYERGTLETSNVYKYSRYTNRISDGAVSNEVTTTGGAIRIDNTGSEQWNISGYLYFYGLGNNQAFSSCTGLFTKQRMSSGGSDNDAGTYNGTLYGCMPNINLTVDGIRLRNTRTTTADGGIVSLYGIREYS